MCDLLKQKEGVDLDFGLSYVCSFEDDSSRIIRKLRI